MLWQKESAEANALYTNYFDQVQNGTRWLDHYYAGDLVTHEKFMAKKNNEISSQRREMGNSEFKESTKTNMWTNTIELYNDSLRFAKNGSVNIALAYGNRSACFYRMGLYNECLIDIELAKKANYPESLGTKLDERKELCLKRISEVGESKNGFDLKLDFNPNEKFPCLADVVKIDRIPNSQAYGLFATKDIDVGKVISVDKAFTTYVFDQYGSACNICLGSFTNLIPCPNCTEALFCRDCQGHFLHEYECGIRYTIDINMNGQIMSEFRNTIYAISMFSSIDELMSFVEDAIKSNPYEMPTSLSGYRAKYRVYLKLPVRSNPSACWVLTYWSFCVYNMILDHPVIGLNFQSTKHQRFLMHFTMMNFLISKQHSQCIQRLTPAQMSLSYDDGDQVNFVRTQTNIIKKYLKHSCNPNVVEMCRNGDSVLTTIRPIKKGDQLLNVIMDILKEPNEMRRKILLEVKYFNCMCLRCQGIGATIEQRQQLQADPEYQQIILKQGYEEIVRIHKLGESQQLITTAKNILRKFGHFKWCEEIGNVIDIYLSLLRILH